MKLAIGNVVRLLRGSAKGQDGKVLDMSKEYDQVDVEIKDGTMRYVGYNDVEVLREA